MHISGTVMQPSWTTVTFQNSWVNYGGGWGSVAFFKDTNGIVHLRGLAMSGTCGNAAFTLPTGYRPGASLLLTVNTNQTFGRVDVQTNGGVVPGANGGACNNTWVSFDGITFLAEQ
jgi:hypothetical protein